MPAISSDVVAYLITESNDTVMNNELERMWQEAVVNCSEVVLSRYFPCRTEENRLNFGEGNRRLNLKILEWNAGLLPAGTRLLIDASNFWSKKEFR